MAEKEDLEKELEKTRKKKEELKKLEEEWTRGGLTPGWWAQTGLPQKRILDKEEQKLIQLIHREKENFYGNKSLRSPENNQEDPLQEAVITAPVSDRILVDAGPGTGKTDVACRRVAHLINNQHVYPNNILLISFTRAAIHEIRKRIGDYLTDKERRYFVRISTIDSYASEIIRGYNDRYTFTGSYDDSIAEALRLIKEDDATAEIFEKIEHLIIDESQDIIGVRADFLISFIKKLQKNCGITIFSDNAQAIYDWLAKEENNSLILNNTKPLSHRINQELPGMFKIQYLKTVHRTTSDRLKYIFTETRSLVLNNTVNPAEKRRRVIGHIRQKAHIIVPRIEEQVFDGCENYFILYRSNREILYASAQINKKNHRIRMRGLPSCIQPWIGACLSEYTDAILDKHTFNRLWKENTSYLQNQTPDMETAWKLLLNLAADTEDTISIKHLRARLWHSHPPDILCTKEIGPGGPIISTIHASKGREADIVHLMLPKDQGENRDDLDDDAETRVIFVGATRACKKLGVGEGYGYFNVQVLNPYNRIYALFRKNKEAYIQIGCENDITAQNLAKDLSEEQIRSAQKTMREISGKITSARMERVAKSDFRYRLKSENGTVLADISEGALKEDFFRIKQFFKNGSGFCNLSFPNVITDLRIFGIRTVILKPGDPECDLLKYPWNKSGILLAPIIVGFPKITFQERRESPTSGDVIQI